MAAPSFIPDDQMNTYVQSGQAQTPTTPAAPSFIPDSQADQFFGTTPTPAPTPTATSAPVSQPGPFTKLDNAISKPAYDMSTENRVLPTIGKTIANQAKSVLQLGYGIGKFALSPFYSAPKAVAQVPAAATGAVNDFTAAKQSQQNEASITNKLIQQYNKMKANGQDTSHMETMMKGYGIDPTKVYSAPKTSLLNNPVSNTIAELPSAATKTLAPAFVSSALEQKTPGDMIHSAVQSVAENPQQLAPYFLAGSGKEGLSSGSPAVDTAISKTAAPIVEAASSVGKGASSLATNLAKFGTSQATGMSPSTITNIISNPDSFSPSEIASNSREALATDVLGKVNDRLGALSETGKEYQPLRQQSTPVNIPTGSVESVLQKHGITADSSGNLQFTKDSIPTSPADRAAIQDWYSTYGKDANHNSNSFLNARKGLDNLAQFDTAKTDAANVLARDLRSTWNKVGRPQVAGLENLDTKFSGETQQLQKVKTDYFNKDGTLKDNAVSKLANLSNAGRGSVLARLENIVPGVTKKIQTLKAVEDIQAAGGQKVGTYARAGLGVTGLATFNPAMIVSAIISEPHIATQILRGYGKLIGASPTIVEKAIGGIQSAATKEFFKPK